MFFKNYYLYDLFTKLQQADKTMINFQTYQSSINLINQLN